MTTKRWIYVKTVYCRAQILLEPWTFYTSTGRNGRDIRMSGSLGGCIGIRADIAVWQQHWGEE